MGKITQERLNLNLESFITQIQDDEIELAINYLNGFEKMGYDVNYFKKVLEFRKMEKFFLNDIKSRIIKTCIFYLN